MQDIIDFINKNHAGHSHLAITLRVLQCLAYIETYIEDIAAKAGVESLLRDPNSKLAFHIVDYPTPDIARDQLLKLVHEVRGAFHDLMAIEDELLRREAVSTFLNNISDSKVGCMEARLRPALMHYALYQSSGCLDLDNLMHEFVRQHENQQLKDMLDFFALRVEHHMPVRDHAGNIVPLTWDIIKNYFRNIMMWDDIDNFWRDEAKTLTRPTMVNSKQGRFCNFENEADATRLLAYIKSLLPDHSAELSKAAVKYNLNLKAYHFWLSHWQYHLFEQAFEKPVSKDKEEEILPVDTSILLQEDCADKLTYDQLTELRNRIRANAKKFTLKGDFVIKSLRADELYFVRQFIETVAPPHIKHPLRRKLKCYFTVTGAGIFQRKGTQHFPDVPMKTPQFSEAEKQGFSKTQSSSFGWEDHHPNVFGSTSRGDKLVGVLVESQNVLLTDRLFLYDNGTLYRPYDHPEISNAKQYYQEKCNQLLFRSANVNEFKVAILGNKSKKYNEAMVRMRWGTDSTSKCFVASDTMEARILIQDNARIKKQHLVANGLMDASQTIPICYYFPDQPDLHLKEYTAAEQQLDRLIVQRNYRTDPSFIQLLIHKQYELLLALPPECIINVFKQEYSFRKINIILVMMSQGYIHIVTSLLEKVPEHKEALLQIILDEMRLAKTSSPILEHLISLPTHQA